MRILLLSIFTSCLLLLTADTAFSQMAKKYALAEHFTNASCPPCAEQNPGFNNFYLTRTGLMHHIAYHTSWPGTDPMYDFNESEVDNRVTYYGVDGVPTVVVNGLTDIQPSGVDDKVIGDVSKDGSDVRIILSEATEGDTRTVDIDLTTVGTVPTGNWRLKTAVVERHIIYDSPPGSNGEADFPNVFRQSLSGITGESVELPATGETTTISYSYALDAEWDPMETYVIAYLQDDATKEVLNSGSSRDMRLGYFNSASTFQQASAGEEVSFSALLETYTNTAQVLQLDVITDEAPADWTVKIMLPVGETVIDIEETSTSYEFPANSSSVTGFKIIPGEETAIAKYSFRISSADDENAFPIEFTYYVNTGVTDLVINNGSARDYENSYTKGLGLSGNTSYGALEMGTFLNASEQNLLEGINNVYLNIGWTFPAITDDMVFAFSTFMDNGGNLLIAGQDIGWDNSGADGSNGTSITRSFYSQYLQARYIDDGGSANSTLTPVGADGLYGDSLSETDIADTYGGNFYPDQIEPRGDHATAIFNYNGDASKIAGIRADNGTFKMAYVGIGLEMFEDEGVRDAFMLLTENWFNGKIVGVEYDEAVQNLMSPSYPNPSNLTTNIQLNNLTTDATLQVIDITGKVVLTQNVERGTSQININTATLSEGTYMYQLVSEQGTTAARKLTVVH